MPCVKSAHADLFLRVYNETNVRVLIKVSCVTVLRQASFMPCVKSARADFVLACV